jgi:hypothetical protein
MINKQLFYGMILLPLKARPNKEKEQITNNRERTLNDD